MLLIGRTDQLGKPTWHEYVCANMRYTFNQCQFLFHGDPVLYCFFPGSLNFVVLLSLCAIIVINRVAVLGLWYYYYRVIFQHLVFSKP